MVSEVLVQNEKEGSSGRTTPDLALYWDSWDSVTKTSIPNTAIQHNDNITQNSSSILNNITAHENIPQTTSDNRSPPSTPSILKGRGIYQNSKVI